MSKLSQLRHYSPSLPPYFSPYSTPYIAPMRRRWPYVYVLHNPYKQYATISCFFSRPRWICSGFNHPYRCPDMRQTAATVVLYLSLIILTERFWYRMQYTGNLPDDNGFTDGTEIGKDMVSLNIIVLDHQQILNPQQIRQIKMVIFSSNNQFYHRILKNVFIKCMGVFKSYSWLCMTEVKIGSNMDEGIQEGLKSHVPEFSVGKHPCEWIWQLESNDVRVLWE